MIPFLVVDRPASLRIIKGANLDKPIGLMSHANTTPLFRDLFRSYPCGEDLCHAINPLGKTKCKLDFDASKCDTALGMRQNTIKMCDCGMFTKDGAQNEYPELFKIYDYMGADYGIMLDVFRDKDATIKSAQQAIEVYKREEHKFRLVLVAQGNNVDEFLSCYEKLQELGGEYIAIGGLLQRVANTVRYVQVRSEADTYEVLKQVREKFNPDWLFALGCYHPKRHDMFEQLGVWGSDYKGWIFQYKKRERLIQRKWEEINAQLRAQGHAKHELVSEFAQTVKQRAKVVRKLEKEEHKKATRNVSLASRSSELIKLDTLIHDQLDGIRQNIYLDGTSKTIRRLSKDISLLAKKTEQQVRYEQVRFVIQNLVD
jgi:hypothetical protein